MHTQPSDKLSGMQLLRHTPRFETGQNPNIHVEEIEGKKVSVRGSVTSVSKVRNTFRCSMLSFRCQVRRLAVLVRSVMSEFGTNSLQMHAFWLAPCCCHDQVPSLVAHTQCTLPSCCGNKTRQALVIGLLPASTFRIRQCLQLAHLPVQLELTGDDGNLIPKEFPAVIFCSAGPKGRYKLDNDEQSLRQLWANDAEVTFVGRFKPNKSNKGGAGGAGEFSFNVTDFSRTVGMLHPDERPAPPAGGAAGAADGDKGQAADHEAAIAVYPQRCARDAECSSARAGLPQSNHCSLACHCVCHHC